MSKKCNATVSKKTIKRLVKNCLQEDIKKGDLTARLTPKLNVVGGKIISREQGVICGTAWVDEVFKKLSKKLTTKISINWQVEDGESVAENQTLCLFEGFARPILSGERTALNILQTLSGTATITRQYVELIKHTRARLLDTRKTLPGMRKAQKYAVLCGGGYNHRMGLYDGVIIKENHLRSGKSISEIVASASSSVDKETLIVLEVENLLELKLGLDAGAKRIMLDDFSFEDLREAVSMTEGRADLEASGGVNLQTIKAIAETGVDFISCGAITKHVKALDLSMLFDN